MDIFNKSINYNKDNLTKINKLRKTFKKYVYEILFSTISNNHLNSRKKEGILVWEMWMESLPIYFNNVNNN